MGTKSILENKSSLSTLISPVSPPTSACSSSEFSGFHLPPVTTRIYPYTHFPGNNADYRSKNGRLKHLTCHKILGAFFWFALGTFISVLVLCIVRHTFQWDILQLPFHRNGDVNSFVKTDPKEVDLVKNSTKTSPTNLKVKCVTPVCMEAAARILHRIDPHQDPCDDFYQFSCGSFIAHNEIPDDSFQRSTLQEMQESILVDIKSKFQFSILRVAWCD